MAATHSDRAMAPRHESRRDPGQVRKSNLRTALVLASIAATFFVGVIASKFMGGYETGMAVVGFAVLVFLCFAIGRNLRKDR